MDKTLLTPEESFLLITKTIEETKKRFTENGHIYIFWGFLIFLASLSQFILLRMQLFRFHYFPYFLMPLGAIYTFIHYWKKGKRNELPETIVGNILKTLGIVLGANFMILGFIFGQKLGAALVPIFLIFLALWSMITGISFKFKPLIIGGLVLNLIGIAAFYFNWQYHPLIMSVASVIALIIPGILLNTDQRKEYV